MKKDSQDSAGSGSDKGEISNIADHQVTKSSTASSTSKMLAKKESSSLDGASGWGGGSKTGSGQAEEGMRTQQDTKSEKKSSKIAAIFKRKSSK